MINYSKNPYGPNLAAQNLNTSKIPSLRGSYCKLKGVPPISHREDPEIRYQRQKDYGISIDLENLAVDGNNTDPPPLCILAG